MLSSQEEEDKNAETNTKNNIKKGTVDLIPLWELSHQFQAHAGNSYGHSREITSIAVSDCNRFLASASFDKTIKIWDARSFTLIRCIKGHTQWATSVSFLRNKIVSGSWDSTIKIWEEKKCIKTLSFHSDVVTSVCVSSSKRLIASGSCDQTVRVFDFESNRSVHILSSHSYWVTSVVFSGDDREIVSGSLDRSIKVWKTETGELLRTLNGNGECVLCVRTAGNRIVSSSYGYCIRAEEREEEGKLICLEGHTGFVTRVDTCNEIVASMGGSNDNSIKVWDLESGKHIQSLEGHGFTSIYYIDSWWEGGLRILEEGQCIVSGGADGVIKVWRRRNE